MSYYPNDTFKSCLKIVLTEMSIDDIGQVSEGKNYKSQRSLQNRWLYNYKNTCLNYSERF